MNVLVKLDDGIYNIDFYFYLNTNNGNMRNMLEDGRGDDINFIDDNFCNLHCEVSFLTLYQK